MPKIQPLDCDKSVSFAGLRPAPSQNLDWQGPAVLVRDDRAKGMFAMKRQLINALAGLWVAGAGAVHAQDQGAALGTVVELYTSQGCSSCPPADEYLRKLATQPGVIALSLHVDYWDYIGWTDKFGNAKFTERQKAYARAVRSNTIYTPQMIVGGEDRVEGTDPALVEEAIRRHQAVAPAVSLQLTRQGGRLQIAAPAAPTLEAPLRVELVRYQPQASVAIQSGENAGMSIDYTNIVTGWSQLGQWDGKAALKLEVPLEGSEPLVVILQSEGPGRIYAAAALR